MSPYLFAPHAKPALLFMVLHANATHVHSSTLHLRPVTSALTTVILAQTLILVLLAMKQSIIGISWLRGVWQCLGISRPTLQYVANVL